MKYLLQCNVTAHWCCVSNTVNLICILIHCYSEKYLSESLKEQVFKHPIDLLSSHRENCSGFLLKKAKVQNNYDIFSFP